MSDDGKPKTISDPYDAGAAVGLINDVFPKGQVDTLHALTGVPVRSITRWLKGDQRVPPTLLAKFREQREKKLAFLADLEALLDRHSESGMLHEAMRQALIVEINSDFFKVHEEL